MRHETGEAGDHCLQLPWGAGWAQDCGHCPAFHGMRYPAAALVLISDAADAGDAAPTALVLLPIDIAVPVL